jgi:hypothetical protein
MKLQNFLRTQVMVIGFGAALVMANATHAQEIVNTVWEDGTTTTMQPAPAQAQPGSDLNTVTDSGALNLVAMSTTSIVARESSIPPWKPAKDQLLISLIVIITLVGLYAFTIARRANHIQNARSGQVNGRTVLS